jgi:hypothetical protein
LHCGNYYKETACNWAENVEYDCYSKQEFPQCKDPQSNFELSPGFGSQNACSDVCGSHADVGCGGFSYKTTTSGRDVCLCNNCNGCRWPTTTTITTTTNNNYYRKNNLISAMMIAIMIITKQIILIVIV